MPRPSKTAISEQAALTGERIRQLRKIRGMTLVQLAEQTGLSHSFLSQIERGIAQPSMQSFYRISNVLGTSQLELVADDQGVVERFGPAALLRSALRPAGSYGGTEAEMLAHAPGGAFTAMLNSGHTRHVTDYFQHDEDEFVFVILGRVEVDLGDDGTVELDTGDSLYLLGGIRHRWRSADGQPYRMFVVKERVDESGGEPTGARDGVGYRVMRGARPDEARGEGRA